MLGVEDRQKSALPCFALGQATLFITGDPITILFNAVVYIFPKNKSLQYPNSNYNCK